MALIDYRALGQAIDTTWGRPSTSLGASTAVKFRLLGRDMLEVTYITTVNFASERGMLDMKERHSKECTSIINETLKGVKATYKSLVSSLSPEDGYGKTLKLAPVNKEPDTSIEVINFNVHNPKRTCLFRARITYKISA